MVATEGGAAFLVGESGPFVALLDIGQPPQQFLWSELLFGQEFTHHPVHLGTSDLGHLFPPNPAAGSTKTLRPAGTW